MQRGSADGPVVTVLMAARNAQAYLNEALESIRAQTMTDWELVVVDDASEDDTVPILEAALVRDRRIRLVRRSRSGGPFVAANEGLGYSRGTYIARMDADDISLPHRLESQVRFLRGHPQVRACAAKARMLVGDRTTPTGLPATPTSPGAIKWGTCMRGYLQGAAMIEATAFREIGGYRDLPAGQDHRLWCELSRRRWLGVLEEVVLHYRQHERQISRTQLDHQRRLVIEAVSDHLIELTGERWSNDDVYVLWSVGQHEIPWSAGFAAIRRFEDLWRADATLSDEDRKQLRRLGRTLRRCHAREAVRAGLSTNRAGRALLGAYRRAAGAVR